MPDPIPDDLWFRVAEAFIALNNRHHPTPEFDALTPHQRALFAIVVLDVEIGTRGIGAMLGRGCVWLLPLAIPALDALGLHDRARTLEAIQTLASELGAVPRVPGATGCIRPLKDPRFEAMESQWKAFDRRQFNRTLSRWVAANRGEFPDSQP